MNGLVTTLSMISIWIWDIIRESMTRLTRDERSGYPLWTPDGKRIVFVSSRGWSLNVYWKAADGTGEVEQLGSMTARGIAPSSWSGDGNSLVLTELSGATGL
jgi:Tol biopolymer transport system component